jgi:uncharacterized protein YndB with AHSA1/START domain
MTIEPLAPYLEPLRKSLAVGLPPGQAFELFTAGLGRWWPLRTHSVFQERAATCGLEPRVGGALFEQRDDGARSLWGTVLVWEPPRRFVVSWHPGREAETAQELEVRFLPEGAGTRVELEHRGWQRLGAAASESRAGYDQGWDGVLARYVEACRG